MKFRKGLKIMALAAAAAVLWGSFTGCGNENSATTSDGKTRISIGNWPSKEGKDKENMEKKKERPAVQELRDLPVPPVKGAVTDCQDMIMRPEEALKRPTAPEAAVIPDSWL